MQLRHARRLPVCDPCLETIVPADPDSACRRCGRLPPREGPLCLACHLAPPAYDSARSWAIYAGAARELIHLLKYGGVLPVADYLAAHMRELPRPAAEVVVAVPLARRRRRERGFNQSERVAARLAWGGPRPLWRALWRRRETKPQAGLNSAQRRANVEGAFVASRRRVEGRRVLLVDDVLTTGATANACAAALKRAGAREVHLVTAARAEFDAVREVRGVA